MSISRSYKRYSAHPFNSWDDCWSWLKTRFGEYAHSTTDAEQIAAGYGRASINVSKEAGWTIKARLYFDFNSGVCNVVPLGLATTSPLKNVYPKGSLSEAIFDALTATLPESLGLPVLDPAGSLNGLARVNTFCNSLLFADVVLGSLSGLVVRESLRPFSLDEVSMQFGPAAARNCEQRFSTEYGQVSRNELQVYLQDRQDSASSESCGLLTNERNK